MISLISFILLVYYCLLHINIYSFIILPSLSLRKTSEISSKIQLNVLFRNVKQDDLKSIAKLCYDCFDNPLPWYQFLATDSNINKHYEQLLSRFQTIEKGYQHAMIVCIEDNDIIGFVEVGLLPSPIKKESLIIDDSTSDIQESMNVTESIKAAMTQEIQFIKEVPYLGNVAVSPLYRKKGIGKNLTLIGLKVAEKWKYNEVFVAVDCDNLNALRLYEQIGFVTVLDERDNIFRKKTSIARIFMSKSIS